MPILQAAFGQRGGRQWLERMEAAGIPCGPINGVREVFADPQVRARRMHRELSRPDGDAVPQVACPVNLSATPVDYDTPPPALGQHTEEVLTGVLGLGASEIAALADAGVI